MIRYKIYQNQQQKGLNAGKWFARAVSDETFDLAKLAEHMSKHNSPYSGGVIKGVLSDMGKHPIKYTIKKRLYLLSS